MFKLQTPKSQYSNDLNLENGTNDREGNLRDVCNTRQFVPQLLFCSRSSFINSININIIEYSLTQWFHWWRVLNETKIKVKNANNAAEF